MKLLHQQPQLFDIQKFPKKLNKKALKALKKEETFQPLVVTFLTQFFTSIALMSLLHFQVRYFLNTVYNFI